MSLGCATHVRNSPHRCLVTRRCVMMPAEMLFGLVLAGVGILSRGAASDFSALPGIGLRRQRLSSASRAQGRAALPDAQGTGAADGFAGAEDLVTGLLLLVAAGLLISPGLAGDAADGRDVVEGSHADQSFWASLPGLYGGFPAMDASLVEISGQKVGAYDLGRLLGTGNGFGASSEVYEAVDLSSEGEKAMVAVKVIPKQQVSTFPSVSGIWAECQLLRQVNHPNVAGFRSLIHGRQNLYIVMELAGDRSLASILSPVTQEGPALSVERSRALFLQVATAVAHCHAQGIAHLDLKPANVVADAGGLIVKLVDFGQAVALSKGETSRRGTFTFAAPEILRGRPYDPAAADCWSLGVVLLEMLCGINALPLFLGWEAPPRRGFEEDAARYATDLEERFGEASELCLDAWMAAKQGSALGASVINPSLVIADGKVVVVARRHRPRISPGMWDQLRDSAQEEVQVGGAPGEGLVVFVMLDVWMLHFCW
ncbi:unnamed protein product [Polarella glacialis]|uniref:Protein kinase domain-containing protein n=1 Tax=Polarella glacialis TaxID=89957 RepID=A0A813GWE2_POLGL|nr:unnamed protein product [Polarella glacialis]